MKKALFILLLYLLITSSLFSQEIKKSEAWQYARKIVDTMASESMHGRGYVNDGDKIAANYMRTEFKALALKSFTDDYYQKFNLSINTFPDTVEFSLHVKKEKGVIKYKCCFNSNPGINFLIFPDSPNKNKSFRAIVFDSTHATEKEFRKFKKKLTSDDIYIIIDDRNVIDKNKLEYFKKVRYNYFKTQGIIELVKQLTWGASQSIGNYSKVQIPYNEFDFIHKNFFGKINIQSSFIPNYQSQNVISYIEGSEHPDSFIVFSAHYDHLGQMGKDVYFPGANDNASGCAMLLNLAKHYSKPENKPKCSIAFIAFGAEEVGLIGSKYFTEHPLIPLKNIKFLLNMDIMGTGEEGITVVNGSVFKKEFEKLKQINTENDFIKDVKIRGKAANSDHYFFSENGVKAFFIYTMGGIKAYHDIYDRPETLPLNEFEDLFSMIVKFEQYLDNE
ncbi:MAG: M28 family metallopeptidase [Bacteroidota bacterium]